MRPYYQQEGVTIYHGDCREVIPSLDDVFDAVITDPVWPNARADLIGKDRPYELFTEAMSILDANRVIVQFGCDSDPRILAGMPKRFPFFRVCWLEYPCPTRKGRLLYTGDVAYVFGIPPKSAPGRRVMPGRYLSARPDVRRAPILAHKEFGRAVDGSHPCPRRLQHLQWLCGWWSDGLVLDPFAGSGTTLLAAKQSGYPSVGIEIDERYCEIAASRLTQGVLFAAQTHENCVK